MTTTMPPAWAHRAALAFRHARRSRSEGTWSSALGARLLWNLVARPCRVADPPQMLKIEITTRCNLGCRFCHLATGSGPARAGLDMSLERIQALLDQLPGLRWIDLQGVGEPLMHPGFEALLELLHARGIRSEFTTNAVRMGPEVRRSILTRSVHRVTVSLPSVSPGPFAALTGRAVLSDVIENTRALACERPAGGAPELRVQHVPLSSTLDEMPRVVEVAAGAGVDRMVVSRYQPLGPDDPLLPGRAALRAALGRAGECARRLGLALDVQDLSAHAGPGERPPVVPVRHCTWAWTIPFVDVEGELRPCAYAPRAASLGNVFRTPVAEAWNGGPYRALRLAQRSEATEGLPCHSCAEAV
jgi:MoaA/NifB/PqqE/SkfB family radical SAM enzyme